MGNTYIHLVGDLADKNTSIFATDQQIELTNKLILRARNGEFHDFVSKHATPKIMLRSELLKLNYKDLADKVINGEYDDESPDDEI